MLQVYYKLFTMGKEPLSSLRWLIWGRRCWVGRLMYRFQVTFSYMIQLDGNTPHFCSFRCVYSIRRMCVSGMCWQCWSIHGTEIRVTILQHNGTIGCWGYCGQEMHSQPRGWTVVFFLLYGLLPYKTWLWHSCWILMHKLWFTIMSYANEPIHCIQFKVVIMVGYYLLSEGTYTWLMREVWNFQHWNVKDERCLCSPYYQRLKSRYAMRID